MEILPWVVGNFVTNGLFHYSCNTSHAAVPFLVYNILDVAWLPWSPGRELMSIINTLTQGLEKWPI